MGLFKSTLFMHIFLSLNFLGSPVQCWNVNPQISLSTTKSRRTMPAPSTTSKISSITAKLNYMVQDREDTQGEMTSSSLSSSLQRDDDSLSVIARSIDLPAKPSKTGTSSSNINTLLDTTEIAIGRIFMVAAVVLFAGELFTDESILQLLTTTSFVLQ